MFRAACFWATWAWATFFLACWMAKSDSAASRWDSEMIFFLAQLFGALEFAARVFKRAGYLLEIGPGHLQFGLGLADLLAVFLIVKDRHQVVVVNNISDLDGDLFQTAGDFWRQNELGGGRKRTGVVADLTDIGALHWGQFYGNGRPGATLSP